MNELRKYIRTLIIEDAALLYDLYYQFQVPIIDENRNDRTKEFLS
jgi:hypothetical protein